ncbi:MAG: type I-F CRISPR-associated endoribonuclease Cas6/Csy4 [Porticoccaceae bacterium]|nr:type I-F CRISPR-associated endoribonuclease Cas6/Csy4 [Porticoccaceae bacterium]
MTHYNDILLLPDPEFPATLLMNAVYSKLHKVLVDLKSTSIGVSFPKCKKTLGNLLRLHGSDKDLEQLWQSDWLGGMRGYCEVGEILQVPEGARHRRVGRVQTNMSQAKLNRLLKRGSITEAEAEQYLEKMGRQQFKGPYLELQSGSNGHKHRRYVELGELIDQPLEGGFDQFGLSKTATVPWF